MLHLQNVGLKSSLAHQEAPGLSTSVTQIQTVTDGRQLGVDAYQRTMCQAQAQVDMSESKSDSFMMYGENSLKKKQNECHQHQMERNVQEEQRSMQQQPDSQSVDTSQLRCSVNQESYEHQTGPAWSLPQPLPAPAQPFIKVKGVVQPSITPSLPPSGYKVFPGSGLYNKQGKVSQEASPSSKYVYSNASQHATGSGSTLPVTHTTLQGLQPSQSSKQSGKLLTGGYTSASTTNQHMQVRTTSSIPAIQKKSADSIPIMQPPSKKKKVTGDDLDQGIDPLNDVTAVSGVNLREEEENLLTDPSEKLHTSDVMRRFVQEEENRLFLEKGPLRMKMSAIAARCGIEGVTEDTVRCLSLSFEEWLRNMLYKLIRYSEQHHEFKKERHKLIITSDLRREIILRGKEAKEALEQKSSEERDKLNEKTDKETNKEPGEKRAKLRKVQKVDANTLHVNATNQAARMAVGVDDMLIKWQMMAEQGRLKREGETEAATEGQTGISGSGKLEREDANAAGKLVSGSGGVKKESSLIRNMTGRPPGSQRGAGKPQTEVIRHLTLNDVIAFLERDPHFAKSTLLYKLYGRMH